MTLDASDEAPGGGTAGSGTAGGGTGCGGTGCGGAAGVGAAGGGTGFGGTAGGDARDVMARFDKAVAIARCGSPDLDAKWDLLYEAAHAAPAAFELGLTALTSDDAFARCTACDLLGVVAQVYEASRTPIATALIAFAARDTGPAAIRAVVRAAGATADPRTLPLLVRHATSDDADVRRRVAISLTSVMGEEPVPEGVTALLRMTTDGDPEVRNWATFGLGWQLSVDGDDIREALWARTTDGYADAREEGIRGLARRRDPRAVPLVAELLATGDTHVFTFDAAAMLATEALLPALSTFDPTDRGVAEALAACDPGARTVRDETAWALFTTVATRYPELPVALYCERFEPGVWLDVAPIDDAPAHGAAAPQMAGWFVPGLLERAGQDVSRAADLVAADLLDAAGIADGQT